MYDLEKAFKNSTISKGDFERIKAEAREEFPNDDLMYELHVIRAMKALKNGYYRKVGS